MVVLDTAWVWLSLVLVLLSLNLSRPILLCTVILLGLTLGWVRGSAFMENIRRYEDFYNRPVVLIGTAETDAIYGDKAQLSLDLSKLELLEPEEIPLVGKVKIEGYGAPAIYRGDVVRVEGKLRPGFGSRQGSISFGQLEVLGRSDSVIEEIRHRFVAGMQSALPEPLASFGLGILIGQRNTLPARVTEQLSIVGLTHIIAVSGYNLTILVRGTRRAFSKRSKYQSFVISVALIITFLLFTGFSPSIIRAAIVSILSLLAWYWGRAFRPVLLLLLVAALTAGWNPIYIWSDIGWYLSFLAFYGVLVLAPLIIRRIYGKSSKRRALTMLVIESLCAQIMTIPLILFIFNEVSVIALLANVLVVPLVPFAMILVTFAGISGMLVPVLAGWVSFPAVMLLTYMLDVANLLSRIPHVLLNRSVNLAAMLGLYSVIVFVSLVLWRKTYRKSSIITDNNVLENGVT